MMMSKSISGAAIASAAAMLFSATSSDASRRAQGGSDPGLWGITFGTEVATEPHTLYFTAGTSNYVGPMTSGRGAL
jgi:hypothetical protein